MGTIFCIFIAQLFNAHSLRHFYVTYLSLICLIFFSSSFMSSFFKSKRHKIEKDRKDKILITIDGVLSPKLPQSEGGFRSKFNNHV